MRQARAPQQHQEAGDAAAQLVEHGTGVVLVEEADQGRDDGPVGVDQLRRRRQRWPGGLGLEAGQEAARRRRGELRAATHPGTLLRQADEPEEHADVEEEDDVHGMDRGARQRAPLLRC
jgi:hypothetical protein